MLQAVGIMREKLVTVTLEKVVEGCNSMKDIRTAAETHLMNSGTVCSHLKYYCVIPYSEIKIEE